MRSIQYTIRGVPERLDQRLRRLAEEEGKSLNAVLIRLLERGLGIGEEEVRHHDLDDLIGSWVSDPECEAALEDQRRIDPELWK